MEDKVLQKVTVKMSIDHYNGLMSANLVHDLHIKYHERSEAYKKVMEEVDKNSKEFIEYKIKSEIFREIAWDLQILGK